MVIFNSYVTNYQAGYFADFETMSTIPTGHSATGNRPRHADVPKNMTFKNAIDYVDVLQK